MTNTAIRITNSASIEHRNVLIGTNVLNQLNGLSDSCSVLDRQTIYILIEVQFEHHHYVKGFMTYDFDRITGAG